MDKINEKVHHLMDTAKYESIIVFDRLTVVMAELEDGTILVENCYSDSAAVHDVNSSVRVCMEKLAYRVRVMVENGEKPPISLTEMQAETILALANNNLQKKSAALDLHISSSAMTVRLKSIRKNTGKDPDDFFDFLELLNAAAE